MRKVPRSALLHGESVVVDPATGDECILLAAEDEADLREAEAEVDRGEVMEVEDVQMFIAQLEAEARAMVKGSGDAVVPNRDR